MASYVVMEPPLPSADDRAAGARMIRDGFTVVAFLLPLFWFLFHRMWWEAAATLALVFALAMADDWTELAGMATLATLLLSLIAGLEASNWRMAALGRRGWRQWGVVEARDRAEAELRYLAEVDLADDAASSTSVATTAQAAAVSVPSVPARRGRGPALGMFDYPGGQ